MTEGRVEALLGSPGPVIADGALGTELQGKGLPAETTPELWNEERPEEVIAVHTAYAEAGSDILLTNSFGANPVKLERMGLREKAPDLSLAAARLCRQAAGGRPILGSIGPVGALLAPLGTLSPETARAAFALQAEVLAEGGVDGLILETFYDLRELRLALQAVLEVTELPVGCSMTFDVRATTIMGDTVEDYLEGVFGQGGSRLVFVGANCSLGPEEMGAVCARLCRSAHRPVWVKPNAGKPQLTEEGPMYPAQPELFAQQASGWVRAGAKVVGGCCGTTPAHIERIAEVLGRQ